MISFKLVFLFINFFGSSVFFAEILITPLRDSLNGTKSEALFSPRDRSYSIETELQLSCLLHETHYASTLLRIFIVCRSRY